MLRAFFLDDDALHLLDQRALPAQEVWLKLRTLEAVAEAIETLAVRGAPAIGGAAACGMALVARGADDDALVPKLRAADARLRQTRPTAVNLFYALDRLLPLVDAPLSAQERRAAIAREARAICEEDAAACAAMGAQGQALFANGDVVITICHTGALATCGQGTALGVLKSAKAAGKALSVLALETRPLLQGARQTAWECLREGIDVTLITDGMAAFALAKKGVTRAIVGADRVARNGDVANKIGTYALATACQAHGVPFYVAAPSSTFDLSLSTGAQIPIEERASSEVIAPRGVPFAPQQVPVWNPAFDVTPAALIAGIITEKGIWHAPFTEPPPV